MKLKSRFLTIFGAILVLVGCGTKNDYELPKYTVIQAELERNIEIRSYEPNLVATVSVDGDRDDAVGKGFRILANYIFGNNSVQSNIAMTAPVTQRPSEAIAMTAPVTQQQSADQIWVVSFMMPSKYTLETLPKPNNEKIVIRSAAARKVAAIRFSGFTTDKRFAVHEKMLLEYLHDQNIKTSGSPILAYYNDPWTLPWNRRNEVLYEIAP